MAEDTQPGFCLREYLSKAEIERKLAALSKMSRDELLAHKEALENELISVARLLNGLEP
jgi:hypothetical protein